MPSTRLFAPVVVGVVVVLLGLVAARVVAQEDDGPADYSPVSVPTSSTTPTPTTTPSESPSPSTRPTPPAATASSQGDDRYQRVPQTPRAIDDDHDDDDDDDDDDRDDDDHSGHGSDDD